MNINTSIEQKYLYSHHPMKLIPYLFFFAIFCSSCKNEQEKNLDFLKDPSLSIDTKIERYLQSDLLMKKRFSPEEINLLRAFYDDRDYEPIMALTDSTFSEDGLTLLSISTSSVSFGVPNQLCFQITDSLHPVEAELKSVINFSRFVAIIKDGFFDYTAKKVKPIVYSKMELLQEFLNQPTKNKKENYLVKLGPIKDSNYRYLAEGILNYTRTHLIDTVNFSSKQIKDIKSKPKKFAIVSLRNKGYMDANSYSAEAYEAALLSFKLDNGLDSNLEINDYTLEALAESNLHRLNRAAISLDKVRQHANYGPRYVRINIPEYQLYFYNNDSLKAIHRIVVGKRATQTPELVSEIRNIEIFPYWRVPPSIIKHEIMPNVYKNPGYLARNNYKLCTFDDTARIDPTTIDWSTKPTGYNIIQMPSRGNSLGVIKFDFLSNHSVYVHDTPSKGLFGRKIRSFSHGCMRCQSPVELGKLILLNDQIGRKRRAMIPDTLESFVEDSKHKIIPLKRRIPIFVEYQTVTTHHKKITFHLDIYYREDEIIKILTSYQNKKNLKQS